MCFRSPLRAAVLRLIGEHEGFTIAQLHTSVSRGGHMISRAAAGRYVSHLVNRRVLTLHERLGDQEPLCIRHDAWKDWRDEEPKARPGGTSKRYWVTRQSREESTTPTCRQVLALCLRKLRGDRSLYQIAMRAHIDRAYLRRLERGDHSPSPTVERRLMKVLHGQ